MGFILQHFPFILTEVKLNTFKSFYYEPTCERFNVFVMLLKT